MDRAGRKIDHAQRYAVNDPQLAQLHTFIRNLAIRLDKITASANQVVDARLPWALVYTGWTRREEERKAEHYKHKDLSNVIK